MNNKNSISKSGQTIIIQDHPHQLKPSQIKQINKLISTLTDYENTLYYLSLMSEKLFITYLHAGENKDTELFNMMKVISGIKDALCPDIEDGFYSIYTGLQGNWNPEKKDYDRYK